MWTQGVVRIVQPEVYFRAGGECPKTVTLHVMSPRLEHVEGWLQRVRLAVASKVAEAHRKMQSVGRVFVGRAAVLAKSFAKRAKSFEPKRVIVPTVAAKNPRARRAMLAIQKAFRIAYRCALRAWQAGLRESVFPFGTWWMRVHHAARCEPEPATG
jgi:putative transposase